MATWKVWGDPGSGRVARETGALHLRMDSLRIL